MDIIFIVKFSSLTKAGWGMITQWPIINIDGAKMGYVKGKS